MFPYLYKSITRPCLEYGNIIWGPNYKVDEDEIEKVQRYATRTIPSIKHLSYEERLRCLKLPTLKYHRLRGGMIMTYNILNGHLNQTFLQECGWLPESTLLDCLSNLLLEMFGKIIFHIEL